MKTTTTKITYSKYFLTGNLEGLSVRCSFNADPELAHADMLALQAITREKPAKDFMTRATYYVYNVGCEPAAQVV